MSSDTAHDYTMPFGKYKGQRMTDIPAHYLLHMYDTYEWFHGRPREWVEQHMNELRERAARSKRTVRA